MNIKYFSASEFKQAAKAHKLKSANVYKQHLAPIVDAGKRQIKFIISTDGIDRDDDKINQAGWDLTAYLQNPVVLWQHNANELPVGKAVSIGLEDGKLCAVVEFATADMNPMGEQVYQMCLKGFLNATSVGFRVLAWEFSNDPDRGSSEYNGGVDFTEQELMEFSIVNIPSNPEALIQDAPAAPVPVDGNNDNDEGGVGDDTGELNSEDPSGDEEDSAKTLNTIISNKKRYLQRLRILELQP